MADQVLKDRAGRPIGRISTASNGVQTIKDAKGRKKGTYDPRTNKTKDKAGSFRRHWESTDESSVASGQDYSFISHTATIIPLADIIPISSAQIGMIAGIHYVSGRVLNKIVMDFLAELDLVARTLGY